MKKILLSILLLAATALPSLAGQQPDTRLNGGTNVCAAAVTNIYRGATGQTLFALNQTTDCTFEFSYTCTNANAMTAGAGATYTLDGGINGTGTDIWVTNALIFFVPNNGNAITNPHAILTNLTKAQMWPFYRIGEIRNTNISGTNFTALKVRAFTKTGL